MENSRLAAIWDTSEGGWYFKADQHEGTHPYLSFHEGSEQDDEYLEEAARRYARYCGVDSAGDVEIVRP